MAIIKTTTKKLYAIESEFLLRFLASGIKITDAVVDALKVRPGYKDADGTLVQGETINSARDPETGKVYIYKGEAGEGSILSLTKTFTSNALKSLAFGLAKGEKIMKMNEVVGTIDVDTEIKDGLQIAFSVAEKPVVEDGIEFFELTFKSANISVKAESLDSDEEQATANVKSVSLDESDEF